MIDFQPPRPTMAQRISPLRDAADRRRRAAEALTQARAAHAETERALAAARAEDEAATEQFHRAADQWAQTEGDQTP